MLLSSFDVRYRQLRCRMAECRSQFLLAHNVLLSARQPETDARIIESKDVETVTQFL